MDDVASRVPSGETNTRPGRRRVLVVNRVGYLGGVERIILTLAVSLRDIGWDVILACPGDGALATAARAQTTEVAACPFDRMRITADPRLLARYLFVAWRDGARAIERHCRRGDIDVIHVHHPVSALYARRAAKRLGIPVVLHVHETLPARPLYAMALRLAVRQADVIVCVSEAAMKLAVAMGAPQARTQVVYNGIDAAFLKPGPYPLPERIARSGPGPHVGVFGVFEPRKAQHVFLEAATLLAERFPSAHFWLVGSAAVKDKEAYAKRLQHLVDTPPLRGRAHIQDFQSDIVPWVAAMDVVVQPSVTLESFGMALAEALALGKPVVAARVGGMPEVVDEGRTGLIAPPADRPALAAALRTLLADPELRAAFGSRGAADVRRRFAPELFGAGIASAYAIAMTQTNVLSSKVQSSRRRSLFAALSRPFG